MEFENSRETFRLCKLLTLTTHTIISVAKPSLLEHLGLVFLENRKFVKLERLKCLLNVLHLVCNVWKTKLRHVKILKHPPSTVENVTTLVSLVISVSMVFVNILKNLLQLLLKQLVNQSNPLVNQLNPLKLLLELPFQLEHVNWSTM